MEDTHNEIMRTLGGLEAKVDTLLGEAQKTNGRITTLETWKNQATGKLTMITGGLAFVVSIVGVGINQLIWGK